MFDDLCERVHERVCEFCDFHDGIHAALCMVWLVRVVLYFISDGDKDIWCLLLSIPLYDLFDGRELKCI